jgi:hypothetical protein
MKPKRRITLEITWDDNDEASYNIEEVMIFDDGCGEVYSKCCGSSLEVIGNLLQQIYRDQNLHIHILFGNLTELLLGLKVRTGGIFRQLEVSSANDILQSIVYHEYVYFIRNPDNGLTKIGKSNNVNRRLSTIRREVNRECFLLHKVRCIQVSAYQLEAKLHKIFTLMGCHVDGEWFDVSEAECEALLTHQDGYMLKSSVTDFISKLQAEKNS